jgi:hypothetical protein
MEYYIPFLYFVLCMCVKSFLGLDSDMGVGYVTCSSQNEMEGDKGI